MKRYLAILFVLSTYTLCQTNYILPLDVGNYWIHIDSSFSQVPPSIDTIRYNIKGDTIINYLGNDYKVYFWQVNESNARWLLRNESDGAYAYGRISQNDTLLEKDLLIKFPIQVGESWQSNYAFYGDTITLECISTDYELIVPAGTFNCIVFRTSDDVKRNKLNNSFIRNKTVNFFNKIDTSWIYHYWAPNIGFISSKIMIADSTLRKQVLFEYNILASVTMDEVGKPFNFFISQNYPNPFNPTTKIEYSVPHSSNVVIKVFDILGKEIETLVNEEKSIGSYEVEFNAAGLPSGIYFYRLQDGNYIETKKMVLIK